MHTPSNSKNRQAPFKWLAVSSALLGLSMAAHGMD